MAQPQRDVVDRVQRGMLIALIAIVAVLAVALALRYIVTGRTELTSLAENRGTGTGSEAAGTVDALLAQARAAMAESRLVAPAGNNAYENYLAVLEQQSGNVSAREALNDLYGIAVSSADQAVGAGDLDEAERLAGMLGRTNPDSFTVVNLRQRIERARAAIAAAELAEQQRQAQAAAAGVAPPPAPEPAAPVGEVVSDLASMISPTAPPTPAPEPAASTPPPSPPPATTTTTSAAPTQRPAAPAVREARLLSRVDPVYPREAARSRQNGWVEVEFTIGRDGTVSDVRVVDARPARVFNQAAQRAIQEWRFEPRLENGEPVASRMRQRFDFRLD
ncbi:MAG: energy transducer TonB [Xanthomonadales bacterium]|nr:energy transducer TonB [Xanthomonadales bacterium]